MSFYTTTARALVKILHIVTPPTSA